MRICAVVKYPPIQGGVSALSYRLVMGLAAAGHQVSVVTNADEVEDDYRIWLAPGDRQRLEANFPNGGSVTLVPTSPLGRKLAAHIPDHKPFATKLAALATEEIRRIDAEVVFSYYLEPYGVAASLASLWTGVPHVVQHAGSDRTRLLSHPDMSTAYREVLRHAELVVANAGTIEGFGVPAERIVPLRPRGLPAAFLDPEIPALDVNGTIAALAATGHPWITNTAPMPADRVTFGIYGKLGEYKGTYDLVAALARLRDSGRAFNFLVMGGGYQRERFLSTVANAGLTGHTWTLPFLPHWRVPEFLRAVTAACFLERRFPVRIHTPGIPREVMTVGTCLVLSREVADKQPIRDQLRHGENAFVVEEPSDTSELCGALARVADDAEAARAIGKAGQALVQVDPDADAALAANYAEVFRRAVASRAGTPVPPVEVPAWRRLLDRYAPASLAALGPAAAEELLAPVVAGDFATDAQRAHAAATALVERIAQQNGALPEPVRAVARFERDLLWSSVDLESAHGAPLFPRRGASAMVLSDPVSLWTRVPVLATTLRIRRYPENVQQLRSDLCAGRTVPNEAGPDATFLFVKRGDLDGRVSRLNPATERALALCDGRTSVAAVRDRLVEELGAEPAQIERLLLDLMDMRAILF